MVRWAALALPIGLYIPSVDAEVAMLGGVDRADVELVESNEALKIRQKVADLPRLSMICRKVCGWDG